MFSNESFDATLNIIQTMKQYVMDKYDLLCSYYDSYYEQPLKNIYRGEVNEDNQFHGYGRLDTQDYMYKGGWRNSKKHGLGLLIHNRDVICDCTWNNGKIRGMGEIKQKGETFFGYFIESPDDNKLIYTIRRSRRIAKFEPENKGLTYKTKNNYKVSNTFLYYSRILDDWITFICILNMIFCGIYLFIYTIF